VHADRPFVVCQPLVRQGEGIWSRNNHAMALLAIGPARLHQIEFSKGPGEMPAGIVCLNLTSLKLPQKQTGCCSSRLHTLHFVAVDMSFLLLAATGYIFGGHAAGAE